MPSWFNTYERFGFFQIRTPLPPNLAHAMGFFDENAMAVGFYYDEALGRVVAVTEDGVRGIGHEAVLAAVLHRTIHRDSSTAQTLDQMNGDEADLALLIEPRIKGGYYIGTARDLLKLFNKTAPADASGFPTLPPRLDKVDIGSHSFAVMPAERVAFNGVQRWFDDHDRTVRRGIASSGALRSDR